MSGYENSSSSSSMEVDNTADMRVNSDTPVLHLFIDEENGAHTELVKKYENQVNIHNQMMCTNPYPDSGFDMYVPPEYSGMINVNARKKVDFKIIAMMQQGNQTIPFYIYARSSISKTPLQLCNNVGIIDCGYRGHLMSYFANHCTQIENSAEEPGPYMIEPFSRLTQICHPSLTPFIIELHSSRDYFTETQRADGGFGSTGV